MQKEQIIKLAAQVIDTEANAVLSLKTRLGDKFYQACQMLLECPGKIIVLGMGKSGHIASKIAATLASTGSPAFFVHPADASHGDLGMISHNDIIIAISNSGNTGEILDILPVIKKRQILLISLTGNPDSILAKSANVNLNVAVKEEACPLGLAPTSSTTAALVMGDAIAVVLLKARGFTKNDFALSHPGGSLGKKLLLGIDQFIRTGNAIPKVPTNTKLPAAIVEITSKRLGMTTIVDEKNELRGIFTDGDLRRAIDKGIDLHETTIQKLMNPNYKTIGINTLAYDALKLMEEYSITSLIVLDDNKKMCGIVHMHDILKAGINK